MIKDPTTPKKKKLKLEKAMTILSSFTHPHVVPNLYEVLLLNTNEDILKNVGHQTVNATN